MSAYSGLQERPAPPGAGPVLVRSTRLREFFRLPVFMEQLIIAILRYAVDVDSDTAGEPEDIVLRDRVLQLLGVTWIAMICATIAFT